MKVHTNCISIMGIQTARNNARMVMVFFYTRVYNKEHYKLPGCTLAIKHGQTIREEPHDKTQMRSNLEDKSGSGKCI